ncbi:MAG: DNA mismatch repair protein MutS [Caulobacteraceae bacterium]
MNDLAAEKSAGADPGSDLASPVMAQYFAAKAEAKDALVLFRMGDFYELFFEDAEKAAQALGIALTRRGTHAGKPIPMAGVPVHAIETYLARLIREGFTLALCEQMESPAEAKKRGSKSVVRRQIVRVVTPGTLTEEALLDARGANRLAAVALRGGLAAAAFVELSTGDVECTACEAHALGSTLAALAPSEILLADRLLADPDLGAVVRSLGVRISPMAAALAEPAAARSRLERLFGVASLEGLGAFTPAEISALGLIGAHLEATQPGASPLLRPPRRTGETETMAIDPATRASLEIDRGAGGSRAGSLLAALDRTVSAPGARLLEARLARPSTAPAVINARLDAIAFLLERPDLRTELRALLAGSGDLSRSVSRLALGRAGPRDLDGVRRGLRAAAAVRPLFEDATLAGIPAEIENALAPIIPPARLAALAADLETGLRADLPLVARDGGFIAQGRSAELDSLRRLGAESREMIAAMEASLASKAGIALKIRRNAVLGYFVEASAAKAQPLFAAPLNGVFLHRQTLAGQVRFTTLELADLDARIARAGEGAIELELKIFEAWRSEVRALGEPLLALAEALASLDLAAGLAQWAEENRGTRPLVDDSVAFEIRGARHPVVEAAVRRQGGAFTTNDCLLDASGEAGPRLVIVTGPNMAGKSTFLRQNALLAVMAQAGAFVPAEFAKIGIVDRLFSRVGAADDLARGRSTFMAEMVEAAAILLQATFRSFVILDEIGRGTATWDGLAIAWACAEQLHEANRCRTLFASHFHELAQLESRLAFVANLNLAAKEWNGELVFLHEARPGAADRSYGVQVARLAGVPAAVVARAKDILERLEREAGAGRGGLEDLPLFAAVLAPPPARESEVERRLKALDVDGLSAREALEALYGLKALAGN